MAKRVALIGHPVEHSLSAALQQAAFDAAGVDASYELEDRLLIDLPEAINGLRGNDSLGANITVPYKERVVPMIDRLTDEAQQSGAVDTITREGSRLIGHNTDVLGFRPALDALIGKQKMPKAAIVLGAGGGARATVYGLITAGFQRVIVFNRHLHRAEGLVRHFGRTASHMELRAMPWHESVIEAELAKTKLLINASSIGREKGDAHPRRAASARVDGARPAVRAHRDAVAARCQVGRRHGGHERRRDAPAPERRSLRAVDRAPRADGRLQGSAR